MRTIYHLGGYDLDKPQHNAAEVWDETAGIVTRYDEDGNVVEIRSLTADETDELTQNFDPSPNIDPVNLADQLAAMQETLDLLILNALEG